MPCPVGFLRSNCSGTTTLSPTSGVGGQESHPTLSCCSEADAYWADSFEVDDGRYVATITDERYCCSSHGEPDMLRPTGDYGVMAGPEANFGDSR